MPTLISFIQHSFGCHSHSNQRGKIWFGKKELTQSLFAGDMMLYMENHKEFSLAKRKLLELINEFGKVAEYKINIQKCVAVLYANNEISKLN